MTRPPAQPPRASPSPTTSSANKKPAVAPTARQTELVDHALELAREVGLAGLTVRRLAERMGFSEAALYRHFPNKQALLLALVDRIAEQRLLAPIRRLVADPRRTAGERLEDVLRHHLSTVLELDGLPILVLAEAAAAQDEALLARFRQVIGELGAIVRRLVAEGALGEPPCDLDADLLPVVLFGPAAISALLQRLVPDAERESRTIAGLPGWLVRHACRSPQPAARPQTPDPGGARQDAGAQTEPRREQRR